MTSPTAEHRGLRQSVFGAPGSGPSGQKVPGDGRKPLTSYPPDLPFYRRFYALLGGTLRGCRLLNQDLGVVSGRKCHQTTVRESKGHNRFAAE